MKAEIITIGDELLIGQTIDTNSAWIGSQLSMAGFDIQRKTSIHDNRSDILKALSEAAGKADVIIITGGLGPTSDDITRQTLCEFFGTKLVLNREVLEMIEKMMLRRKIPMNENNRKQAEVPEACKVLKNRAGTAPGLWFEKDRSIFISMPGVPYEMKTIMADHVLPRLMKRFRSQAIIHKNIMTYGAPEARLAEMLKEFEAALPENIRLAYLPSFGVIKLRLTGTGKDREILKKQVEEQVRNLSSVIPDLIFSEKEDTFESVLGLLLLERKETMCTAESCTGGNIAHMITTIPGSSYYFKGSVVAYSNAVKEKLLGVEGKIIEEEGAVSEPVVRAMAEGARRLLNTDYALATSGIAGPEGGTDEKPVGTLWIAAASANGTYSEQYTYGGDRITNIMRFSNAAMNLLRKQIIKE
jgi:nicotinamide-nucleotide amidase